MGFLDLEVTRFENGVTNRGDDNIFNALRCADPSVYSQYYNDFLSFNTVVPGAQPDQTVEGVWNVGTLFGTASAGSVNYFGGTQGIGGRIINSTGATLNDDIVWEFGGRPFAFPRGKKCFFKVLANIENVAVPLVNIGVRNAGNAQAPQNAVWFTKPAGVSFFDLNWDRSGNSASLGLTSPVLTDEDDFEVSFYYDGESSIFASVNGTVLGRGEITDANFPYSDLVGNLIPFLYIQNGAASAERIDFDLIFWAMERDQIGLEI